MSNYLKSFIIGSSLPVVLSYYLTVANIPETVRNYSYEKYTIVAPLYFGILNTLSLYVQQKYGLTLTQRFILFGVLSGILVNIGARVLNSYMMEPNEWIRYSIIVSIIHFITWFIIIHSLEKMLKN